MMDRSPYGWTRKKYAADRVLFHMIKVFKVLRNSLKRKSEYGIIDIPGHIKYTKEEMEGYYV